MVAREHATADPRTKVAILMLLAMAAIAGLLIPLHRRREMLIVNVLVSKNNRVRLEAARRTIEELEGRREEGSAS